MKNKSTPPVLIILFLVLFVAMVASFSNSRTGASTWAPAQQFAANLPDTSVRANPCALTSEPPPGLPTTVIPQRTPAAPPVAQPISSNGQLVESKFFSPLLNREMPILVYLPPGYFDSQRRYPVLYMLSGFVGDHREWVYWGICSEANMMMREGLAQPFIIVMPEGDNSYWINHAPVEKSDGKPWGDYVWKDVVNYTDTNYRTIPNRASRAIGGLSAGGQAAFILAFTRPQVFGIAGGHSLSIRGADGSLAFFGDREYFKQYDILWLARTAPNLHDLKLWVDVGADDNQWGGPIRDFHKLLDDYGIKHDWQDTWRGKHNNLYWSAHIADYLGWYASKLVGE